MKHRALAIFHQPPQRQNCAQSVLHAIQEGGGQTALSLADFQRLGGGRAPDGLCGALHAACVLAPARADQLKAQFAADLGSVYCRELRTARRHPCAACVAQAADLLETGTAGQTDCSEEAA